MVIYSRAANLAASEIVIASAILDLIRYFLTVGSAIADNTQIIASTIITSISVNPVYLWPL